jgi:thiamine biosynthesis lipoprotein
MENVGRRRAFKFFVTACVLSAMYHFIMQAYGPVVEIDGGLREVTGGRARIVAVTRYEKKANRAIKAGFDELTRISGILSEDANKVNREAFAGPVKVSPELFEVLQTGIDYCKVTKGEFDITVCDSNGNGCYEKLVLDTKNQTVLFANSGIQLELGEIMRGFAIDKAVEVMKRKGAASGMVDAGGVIRCFGRPAHKANWLIGLREPEESKKQNAKGKNAEEDANTGMVLKLRDMAAVTKVGGVTIIAQRAVVAEVIASAVSEMGAQKGLDLVDSLLGVEAIITTENGVVKSSGADSYLNH